MREPESDEEPKKPQAEAKKTSKTSKGFKRLAFRRLRLRRSSMMSTGRTAWHAEAQFEPQEPRERLRLKLFNEECAEE